MLVSSRTMYVIVVNNFDKEGLRSFAEARGLTKVMYVDNTEKTG